MLINIIKNAKTKLLLSSFAEICIFFSLLCRIDMKEYLWSTKNLKCLSDVLISDKNISKNFLIETVFLFIYSFWVRIFQILPKKYTFCIFLYFFSLDTFYFFFVFLQEFEMYSKKAVKSRFKHVSDLAILFFYTDKCLSFRKRSRQPIF